MSVLEHEYTVKEVAEILHINENTVYLRIAGKSGKRLRARKEGKEYRITDTNLRLYVLDTYDQQQSA